MEKTYVITCKECENIEYWSERDFHNYKRNNIRIKCPACGATEDKLTFEEMPNNDKCM